MITVDYIPPAGDGEGILSLELLLISLATCFGSALKVILCGPMQCRVQALHIKADGERTQTHPTVFQTIRLCVRLSADGIDDDQIKIAASKAEQICPVYAMLKNSVTIETDICLGSIKN